MLKIVTTLIPLLISTTALAQVPAMNPGPYAGYAPTYQQQYDDPREIVQQGVERLKAFIDGNLTSANPAAINGFLQQEIAPYFDFDIMTQLILGPMEYQFDTKQRYAARIMVRNQFLQALASNLSGYQGGQVNMMNVSGNLGMGRVSVRLLIYRPDQYPMTIELRITRTSNGWKIYDVAANGMSAVAHYRNYIQSILMRSGPAGLDQMR